MSSSDSIHNFWLNVGKLVAAQGLRGQLRVNPSSDFSERFTKPGKRWLQEKGKEPQEVELIAGRQIPGKSLYVIQFEGIETRDSAERLVGQSLLVPASHRPHLEEGEFHLLDLVGLEAKLEKGGPSIGRVTGLTTAGNDLLEVQLQEGRKVLIPFVKAIVPEVYLEEHWLLINPPPGLLEL